MASATFFLEVILYGQMGGFQMDFSYRLELYAVVFVLMALAWWRHKENIKRILAGTENQFGGKNKQEK